MAEDRKARYARERKEKEHKEFMEWAEKQIANTVIRSGFAEIRGCLERILQTYEHLPK